MTPKTKTKTKTKNNKYKYYTDKEYLIVKKLTGVQIRPKNPSEFDRRISVLKPAMIRDIVQMLDSLPNSREDLTRYLFSSFDLDKSDRSLVMNYEDYVAIYGPQLGTFFFSSLEAPEEYARRKVVLESKFGTRARLLLRKKIRTKRSVALASQSTEVVLAVPEHTVIEESSGPELPIAETSEVEEVTVDEDSLWSYILEQKDADQLIKELKRVYGDLVNDPSDILIECSKLGITKFTTKIRRSYIFK
jgi:hypothetical protein